MRVDLIVLVSASIMGALIANPPARLQQQKAGPWPEVVSGERLFEEKEKFSIAGEIFSHGARKSYGEGWSVHDLGQRYSSFRSRVGIKDGGPEESRGYRFILDGKIVESGRVRRDEKAKSISIDLTGGGSLRIELDDDVMLAEPAFYLAELPEPPNVVLMYPESGKEMDRGPVTLGWKPVPGATNYVIQIVAERLASSEASDARVWVKSVPSRSSFKMDFKAFPRGDYRWSVIAFDKSKIVKEYSDWWTLSLR